MANIRLTIDDVRRIEKFFREIEHLTDLDATFRNELVTRLSGPNLQLPDSQIQLVNFYLETCRRIIQTSGALREVTTLAKQDVGVILSPTTVKTSVQSLFAQIKKDLEDK